MPLPPLTHHEILGIVEPYTRGGRQVDLAQSQRLERRLVFKPVLHAGVSGSDAFSETLQLENPRAGFFRLTRVLRRADGLEATLLSEGADAGELLARVEAVPPRGQFRSGPGFEIALSQRIGAAPVRRGRQADAAPLRTQFVRGVARAGGLELVLKMSAVRGVPGELKLSPVDPSASDGAGVLDLPEDLLAVLGWDWVRLCPVKDGWTSRLRLRGHEPDRSRRAEERLLTAARHLAQTLAEPPARYHEQRVAARWGVVVRRGIPVLTFLGMILGIMALPRLGIPEGSPIRLLIFNAPPLLLAIGFCMQELPRFEIPPIPRRSAAAGWRKPAAVAPAQSLDAPAASQVTR